MGSFIHPLKVQGTACGWSFLSNLSLFQPLLLWSQNVGTESAFCNPQKMWLRPENRRIYTFGGPTCMSHVTAAPKGVSAPSAGRGCQSGERAPSSGKFWEQTLTPGKGTGNSGWPSLTDTPLKLPKAKSYLCSTRNNLMVRCVCVHTHTPKKIPVSLEEAGN